MQALQTYSKEAYEARFYKDQNALMVYVLGLCGEAGEVAEKFKKLHRDQDAEMTPEFKQGVKKELGDVLWYINTIGQELGFTLEEIAQGNLEKIGSRKARGTQHGNGDDR